ncbi:hypothetical protein RyT2_11710 [Pseudolactococcus yaeyamensis]
MIEFTAVEISQKVARLKAVTDEMAELKAESEKLKVWFEELAEVELANSKFKTARYLADDIKVTVTNAETPKILADKVIMKLLGETPDKYATSEMSYSYKKPLKDLLVAVVKNSFVKQSESSIIAGLSDDGTTRSLLGKKLRGNFEKDKQVLMAVLGMSDSEASDTAYLFEEAHNYKIFNAFLADVGFDGDFDDLVERLKAAVIVEDKLKVSVE